MAAATRVAAYAGIFVEHALQMLFAPDDHVVEAGRVALDVEIWAEHVRDVLPAVDAGVVQMIRPRKLPKLTVSCAV